MDSILLASFVGGAVVQLFNELEKFFKKKKEATKESPKSMSIFIYKKDYEAKKFGLIFQSPLHSSIGLDYLEPPEWICKKDTTYKFIIG